MTTLTARPSTRERDLGLGRHARIMGRVTAAASAGVVAFGVLAAFTWAGNPSDPSAAAQAPTTTIDGDDGGSDTELPSTGSTVPRSGSGGRFFSAPDLTGGAGGGGSLFRSGHVTTGGS